MNDAANSAHSQATVLDFLEFHGVIDGEVKGVEAHFAGNFTALEHVEIRDASLVRDEFNKAAEKNDLPDAGGGDLVEGFSGERVGELGAWKVDELLDDDAEEGEHANATVLDLRLLEPFDVECVGEAERVESDVTNHVL